MIVLGPPPGAIRVIHNPAMPHLRFEFHPATGKVYWMKRPVRDGEKIQAFILAEHCDTHGRAFGFVQSFCRGYRLRSMELQASPEDAAGIKRTLAPA